MMTTTRRILALATDPEDGISELDWIEDVCHDEGIAFEPAVMRVQVLVDDDTLIVVRTEPVP